MPLSNNDMCSFLFTTLANDKFLCNTCNKTYKSEHGFSNLVKHLRSKHTNFFELVERIRRERNPLNLHVVDQRTQDLYYWCEWLVMGRHPFNFVENKLTRQNTSLSPVSTVTIKRYLMRLRGLVEGRVSAELPDSFGIVWDGWSSTSRDYVAIFAVFNDPSASHGGKPPSNDESDTNVYYEDLKCYTRRFLLLAFCPITEEDDLSAQSMFDLVADTLTRYEKPWEYVKFMVGDNCSVNRSIGSRESAIPLIGCASHRFNLAVVDFLAPHDTLIAKVQALMVKLRSIKGRAILRRTSPLAPKLSNDTRWSNSYEMLKRFTKLEPALESVGRGTLEEYEILPLVLSRSDSTKVKKVLQDLKQLEDVTLALQKSTLTMSGARRLLDQTIKTFPQLKNRLKATASIVTYAALETGIVKLQRGETLAPSERIACTPFQRNYRATEQEREDEADSIVSQAFKKRRTVQRAPYHDLAYVPSTSNECERFFSSVKLVYTDLRKSMDTEPLQMLMVLMYNRDLWDVHRASLEYLGILSTHLNTRKYGDMYSEASPEKYAYKYGILQSPGRHQ